MRSFAALVVVVAGLSACPEQVGDRCGAQLPPCPAGQQCVDARCVVFIADAGRVLDASVVDAGTADGGRIDGGLIGLDAGGLDAGAPDGGVRDSGTPDGGTDSGVVDAGVPDAGFPLLDALLVRATRLCQALQACGVVSAADAPTLCVGPVRETLWSFAPPALVALPLDPDAGARCSQIPVLPCQSNLLLANLVDLRTSCPVVLNGPSGLGGACGSDRDCADKASLCAQSCNGTCALAGGLGQPCLAPDRSQEPCFEGFCDGPTNRCAPFRVSDAGCAATSECGPDSVCRQACLRFDAGVCVQPDGRCVRLPPVTSPCAPEGCDTASRCDGPTCVLRTALGQACSNDECVLTASCFGGSCRARASIGAACVRSNDCLAGLSCDRVSRTCQAPRTGRAVGEACSEPGQCGGVRVACAGLFINPDGGPGQPGVCRAPQPFDPCQDTFSCPIAHFCSPDAGVCAPSLLGSPCSNSAFCAPSHACNPTGACQPRDPSGAVCAAEGADSCANPADVCLRVGAEPFPRCRPLPVAGQACAALDPRLARCRLPAVCEGTTCVDGGVVGQPCIPGLGCFDGVCVTETGELDLFGFGGSGRCAPRSAMGGPCGTDRECQQGLVCRSTNGRSSCVGLCP